jgi:hypothetical protein
MAREVAKEADVRSAFGDESVSDNLWADVRADAEKYEGLAARLRKLITKMLGDDVIDAEGWDPAEYAEQFGIEDAEIVYELPPGFEDGEINDDEFPPG